jgi:hypothetical protein
MKEAAVDFLNKPRSYVVLGVLIAAVVLVQQLWVWEVERVEVPPGHFLVRIHLWGNDLPEGEILAPDESFKGVQKDVLTEGRHFINPLFWSYEIHKRINVPTGKCLVLTRKAGAELSADRLARGEYLAGPGERGIVPEVLRQGDHPINPYEYETQLVDAIEIGADQVGIRTLKWGNDPKQLKRERNVYVVPEGTRGVQEKPVTSGTYYINPYVESIVPVDTRTHRVEFTDIEFPSKDGFHLRPHVLVAYKVIPAKAPELFVMLTDQGKLNQGDATPKDQAANQILQKVVLPLIRGYTRIEGSKFDARDFITQKAGPREAKSVNPRERLQQELEKKVAPRCEEVGIAIESITLAGIDSSAELAELASQIADRERARLTREKNLELIGQYKKDQELKATEALKQQETETVAAKTKLEVEKTKAQQLKEVQEAKLKQELAAAQVRLEAARNQAKKVLTLGKSEADVIESKNEAEVAPLRAAIQGFASADQFAQYQVLTRLAPALTEIFASDNSEFAKLIADYMTPKKNGSTTTGENGKTTVVMPPAGK